MELSLEIHSKNTPVLISSQLLRRYGCAQIDISYVQKKQLVLVESKSSLVGILAAQGKQVLRLKRAALFLESCLSIPVHLKFIAKR